MIIGMVLVVLGLVFAYGPKIPFLGRLPGDIYIKKDTFRFYFPITTSILISILLSLAFYLIHKLK